MLVKDLIEALKLRDPDAIVMFSYDYGDHCHTPCVEDIRHVEIHDLYKTAYSPSGLAIRDRDVDGEDDPQFEMEDIVVLL